MKGNNDSNKTMSKRNEKGLRVSPNSFLIFGFIVVVYVRAQSKLQLNWQKRWMLCLFFQPATMSNEHLDRVAVMLTQRTYETNLRKWSAGRSIKRTKGRSEKKKKNKSRRNQEETVHIWIIATNKRPIQTHNFDFCSFITFAFAGGEPLWQIYCFTKFLFVETTKRTR